MSSHLPSGALGPAAPPSLGVVAGAPGVGPGVGGDSSLGDERGEGEDEAEPGEGGCVEERERERERGEVKKEEANEERGEAKMESSAGEGGKQRGEGAARGRQSRCGMLECRPRESRKSGESKGAPEALWRAASHSALLSPSPSPSASLLSSVSPPLAALTSTIPIPVPVPPAPALQLPNTPLARSLSLSLSLSEPRKLMRLQLSPRDPLRGMSGRRAKCSVRDDGSDEPMTGSRRGEVCGEDEIEEEEDAVGVVDVWLRMGGPGRYW